MKIEISKEKFEDLKDAVNVLESLLTDRIKDLHEVKGGMQARHAYCYYRDIAWKAKYILRDHVNVVEEKKK